jgi:hypothetical protein
MPELEVIGAADKTESFQEHVDMSVKKKAENPVTSEEPETFPEMVDDPRIIEEEHEEIERETAAPTAVDRGSFESNPRVTSEFTNETSVNEMMLLKENSVEDGLVSKLTCKLFEETKERFCP